MVLEEFHEYQTYRGGGGGLSDWLVGRGGEKNSLLPTALDYSLTSPYGNLYNKNTSPLRTVRLVPEMSKIIHSLPL